MIIAIDAVGGDHAPGIPVAATLTAAGQYASDDVQFVLLGPEPVVTEELRRQGDARNIQVLDAPEIISVDEPPAQAVRRKRNSSIVMGIRLVAEGKAHAFLSAGSTGALMVAAKLILGTIPGIERPALATLMPTWDGRAFLMLDLGAQTGSSAENLFQYGLMGSVYMERVMGYHNPRVALLNIGVEAGKGGRTLQEAYELLARSELNFVGNVESRHLLDGKADVIVCDGFIGNILLKNMEGMALGLLELMKAEIRKEPLAMAGAWLARRALRRVRQRIDYSEYGGAPLLGIAGVVIKCHGSSNARAISNGIAMAIEATRQGMIDRISRHLVAVGKAVT